MRCDKGFKLYGTVIEFASISNHRRQTLGEIANFYEGRHEYGISLDTTNDQFGGIDDI
jgi:hypothetical protein